METDAESPPTRALVFDADRGSREACMSLLREQGFDCQPAESATAALAMLEAGSFELFVFDRAGGELLRGGLGAPSRPGLLILSEAGTEADAGVSALRAAGRSVIFKPIDAVAFARAVAWVMHARHLASRGPSGGQFEALHRMATTAASDPELTHLLDELLGVCLDTLGANSASIMLASRSKPRELSIVASRGLPLREEHPVSFGKGVAGWVAESQRAIRLVGSLDRYPQFAGLASNPVIAESIIAPIVFRQETLGTLSVSATTPNHLGPENLAVILSAADIAAGAIHRHRLEQAREHQDRLAALGQLSASLVHELNNPLSYVRCNVAALADLVLRPDAERETLGHHRAELSDLLRDLEEGIERMVALTNNTKSAARKSGEDAKPFDLNEVLQRADALVQPQFKHRLKLSAQLDVSVEVAGDAGRILQVVINLLVNAAQAVEKNGEVVLRTRTEGGWVTIEVEDNGPGIPPELAAQLFEPFFTTKPEGEGTGLGLSISRQIAAEHGGTLTFDSEVGKGTRFRLRLPVHRAPTAAPPPRLVALIVDDEPALLRAMVRVLEKDFEVLGCSMPEQALLLAAGKRVDLIVTDFSMPVTNGVALIQALRARGHQAPAILVTAVIENAEIAAALEAGLVCSLMRKPWAPSALLAEGIRVVGTAKALK